MGDPTNITLNAKTETEEIAKVIRATGDAKVLLVEDGDGSVRYLVTPTTAGMVATPIDDALDKRRPIPRRKTGHARLAKVRSFLDYVNRHKTPQSTLFAFLENGAHHLRAVFNPHGGNEAAPGHGDFGALLTLEHSEAFAAWDKVNGKPLDQTAFASLIEERITDIAEPGSAFLSAQELAAKIQCEYATPSKMMQISRGLAVRVNSTIKTAGNLSTGEVELVYQEQHTDEAGAPIKVPGAFLLALPVFDGGAHYQIPVRIRYRAQRGAGVTWTLDVYRVDLAIEAAIGEILAQAALDTGLPVFEGKPA